MEDPGWFTRLVTITAMYAGTSFGALALFPGRVLHGAAQPGGLLFVISAKPLKVEGGAPPVSVFCFPHCASQNVTFAPVALFRSPITNAPPAARRPTQIFVAVSPGSLDCCTLSRLLSTNARIASSP